MTRARDVASQGGLVLISSTTIGSAVSSVVVSNAFSATYDNYKIIISGGVGSTTDYIYLRLGASATNYYDKLIYGAYASGATVSGAGNSNVSLFSYPGNLTTSSLYMNVDLMNPFLTKPTAISSNLAGGLVSGAGIYAGYHSTAASYTDFTVAATSGTMTGGTIKVYGYK